MNTIEVKVDPKGQLMLDPENADSRQNSALKKSCLTKRQVLRDISNQQEGLAVLKKTKQVNFIVEKPDRPSTLTKNRFRRIPTRAVMQPLPNQEDLIAKLIEGLGDVNKATYFQAIKALFCQPMPILANFQAGVTQEFLEYFWSLKWTKEDLIEDQYEYFEQFQKFQVKFFRDADSLDLPTEPTLIILWNPRPDHPYLTTLIDKFIDFESLHRLMIVGDVSLMLDLRSTPVWSNLQLLNCLVTMHDQRRSALFADLTEAHLGKSAGIPSFVLKLLRDKRLPQGPDPEFFWNIKPKDGRVRALAMKLFIFQSTRAPINIDWTYGGVDIIALAQCCGCLVADVSKVAVETPDSSLAALESSAHLAYSSKMVVWPDELIRMFDYEHAIHTKDMAPKSTEVGWLLLEQITAQNMAKQHKDLKQKLGERFTFLTKSFVANIKHKVADSYIIMPQIDKNAEPLPPSKMTMEAFPTLSTVNPKDFLEFVAHVLVPNKPMVCRDKGSTPDWMVKLVDGDQKHLLCIQLKSGDKQHSIYDVVDEMGLSPGMVVKDKDYMYRNVIFQGYEKYGIKLTFVFGAISHSDLKQNLRALEGKYLDKGTSSTFGVLRVTHDSYPSKVPQNVELLILLKAGLINLLGVANYNFIAAYNANTVHENRDSEETCLKSTKDVENMIQMFLLRKGHLFRDRFDVTCTVVPKNTTASPIHQMHDGYVEAPYSPIFEGTPTAESTLSGHVRAREDDEDSAAEHAQKKQKTDGSASANPEKNSE